MSWWDFEKMQAEARKEKMGTGKQEAKSAGLKRRASRGEKSAKLAAEQATSSRCTPAAPTKSKKRVRRDLFADMDLEELSAIYDMSEESDC